MEEEKGGGEGVSDLKAYAINVCLEWEGFVFKEVLNWKLNIF